MAGGGQVLEEMIWDRDDDAVVDAMLIAPARIAVSAEPAENANGPTVALAVAYGIGPDLAELYGGKILNAILIVGVDLDTGNVFANAPVDAHAVPLGEIMPPAPPDLPEADADGELVMAGQVGIDLARVLSLPAKGGRYAVFVWLDRLVSNTVVVEIKPASPREGREATPLNKWPSPLVLSDDAAPDGAPSALVQGAIGPAVSGSLIGGGPGAVLVLDGAARQVFGVVSAQAQASIAVDLSRFLKERAQSRHPSWSVVFDGQTAQQPLRIPPAIH